MLNKRLRQYLLLLLCVAISACLPSSSDFGSPLLTQIDGDSDIVFNLDQGDLDDSILPSRSAGGFSSTLTLPSALQATDCFRSMIGLQFARGPPLFS
jgi:hypothetical protein